MSQSYCVNLRLADRLCVTIAYDCWFFPLGGSCWNNSGSGVALSFGSGLPLSNLDSTSFLPMNCGSNYEFLNFEIIGIKHFTLDFNHKIFCNIFKKNTPNVFLISIWPNFDSISALKLESLIKKMDFF